MQNHPNGTGDGVSTVNAKVCSTCGEIKPLKDFNKDKRSKDGLQYRCRDCNRAYYEANKQKFVEYRKNRDYRAYCQENREKIRAQRRAYRAANRDKVNEYHRVYEKKRRAEDPAFAMVRRLRIRLLKALNGSLKPASTMELLGCSAEKLCAWLEMHFAEGMTWENRDQWHIDHIRPVASFDDPADPACWHWSNLQPLWAEDNLRKGDSWGDS